MIFSIKDFLLKDRISLGLSLLYLYTNIFLSEYVIKYLLLSNSIFFAFENSFFPPLLSIRLYSLLSSAKNNYKNKMVSAA